MKITIYPAYRDGWPVIMVKRSLGRTLLYMVMNLGCYKSYRYGTKA